jgi:hypothetical protein
LNCYAYLIRKYYGFTVSHMEVICIHEDNGDEPYSFVVPPMPAETEFLMASHRADNSSCILDRFLRKL